ncbi:MAG: DNA repair protein RecN [Alphaproteobacteria bacterium]|nr:DNA repair protein RecN [Alphaproteobacteria bacterium]
MLRSLNISDVVLIDRLDIDFQAGFGVLTGETGAGKSILLDSLGLVLGKRGETSLIRKGADKLSVTAVFDNITDKELHKLLQENDIEVDDNELMIKRSLNTSGIGKIFINDQPVSAKLLKEIGKYLVEIHGQFDNQGLLNPVNHLSILDNFGGYEALLKNCSQAHKEYKEIIKKRAQAESDILKAKEDEENLIHWIKELETLSPKSGEMDELQARRQEMMGAEKIIENLNYAYASLTQGRDVSSAIRSAQSGIAKANNYVSGKYDEIYASLDRALIEVTDVIDQIENLSSQIGINANEQENIDSRIFALKDVARKHGCSVDDLPETLEKFKFMINSIEKGEDILSDLRKEEQVKRLAYIESANTLHKARVETAQKLDASVMAELPPLKMEKAKFVTEIKQKSEDFWSDKGFDDVCFTVATNPNSPQGPINKIASGGELSRFMLALKVNLASSTNIPTMIFDEVDAGIGGAVAQAVGERLSRLGKEVQVLVVTHAPQVAALGNYHFKVAKTTTNDITTTDICALNDNERREEIARMLAGDVITDEARAAAVKLMK